MQYRLALTLVGSQPQRALRLAYEWWEGPGKAAPAVQTVDEALARFPVPRRSNHAALAREWLEEILADETLSSALLAAPLRVIPQIDWPEERLVQRAERQPAVELLRLLAPLCMMPDTDEELRSRLIGLLGKQPLQELQELAEHLGHKAIWFPLAYSRVFVSQAEQILGEAATGRILLRGVRETRLVLRLRTRRKCRMRWAPRVDAWLALRPQTELYSALRQEIAYFDQTVVK